MPRIPLEAPNNAETAYANLYKGNLLSSKLPGANPWFSEAFRDSGWTRRNDLTWEGWR